MHPKKSVLVKHAEGKERTGRETAQSSTKPVFTMEIPTISKEVEQAEICLAVCMACHSAIPTVDHVGEIWGGEGEGGQAAVNVTVT